MPRQLAKDLGLIHGEDEIAVVVSHDCDIASDDLDDEPDVEILVGKHVKQVDGNFTHGKNARKLHIELQGANASFPIELHAARKQRIAKGLLAGKSPDSNQGLDDARIRVLRLWLATRYSRSAFPDTLNERLRSVEKTFVSVAKKHPHALLAVFIEHDPEGDGVAANEKYEVWLYLVYFSDKAEYAEQAKAATAAFRSAFEKAYKRGDRWEEIELRGCEAISETEFTLRDLQAVKQYRLEHVSLKQVPPGKTLPQS